VEEFLLALALCHSAFVESAPQDAGGGLLTYQASSPDDEALVLAAAQYGVTLTSVRTPCIPYHSTHIPALSPRAVVSILDVTPTPLHHFLFAFRSAWVSG
jgi:magnesium-transporting ATPase (P-type)